MLGEKQGIYTTHMLELIIRSEVKMESNGMECLLPLTKGLLSVSYTMLSSFDKWSIVSWSVSHVLIVKGTMKSKSKQCSKPCGVTGFKKKKEKKSELSFQKELNHLSPIFWEQRL